LSFGGRANVSRVDILKHPPRQANNTKFLTHFGILIIPKANLSVYTHLPLQLIQKYYPLTSYASKGLKSAKAYAGKYL
jgi:hypothetical protein